MATINLAPGTQYLAAIRRRRRLLTMSSVLITALVFGAWLSLALLIRSTHTQIAQTEAQLRAYETKIAELGKDAARIELFEGRLYALEQLFKIRLSWVPMLKEMERLLPAPAVLSLLDTDLKEGFIEVGGSAPDLDQVSQTLASLVSREGRTTLFTRAELGTTKRHDLLGADGLLSGSEYRFNAKLFFDPTTLRVFAPAGN